MANPVRSTLGYLKASADELTKVVWPTREQAIQYTLAVVVSVIVVTAATAGLDYGLSQLLKKVIAWSGQ